MPAQRRPSAGLLVDRRRRSNRSVLVRRKFSVIATKQLVVRLLGSDALAAECIPLVWKRATRHCQLCALADESNPSLR